MNDRRAQKSINMIEKDMGDAVQVNEDTKVMEVPKHKESDGQEALTLGPRPVKGKRR